MSDTKSILLTIEQKIEAYKWVREKATGRISWGTYECYEQALTCYFIEEIAFFRQSLKDLIDLPKIRLIDKLSIPLRLQALDEVIEELEKQLKEKI